MRKVSSAIHRLVACNVLAVAIDTGQARLILGFEPTPEQVAAVHAARDRWREEQGDAVPVRLGARARA